jgi:predicted ATPase/DNA-binding CsgD family transcriptional regulator
MRNATRLPRAGLPATADLFVGRDRELEAISGLLAGGRTRLVTLTGPPGIGKTRLAIACASGYSLRTGNAAVFVDLAPLQDPARVVMELAQALGLTPRPGTHVIDQLVSSLGQGDRLVVLDNCEHLLAAAADLGEVLAGCERLLVLATSRERLRLSLEQEYPVPPPLAVPALAEVADLGSLAENPSIALMVDRARRLNPRFALTAANAALLVSACARLEGLPLAIELAAARLKVLTPGELVFRLGSRMDVLAGTTRDVPARQRALRTAIEWSYDLLSTQERGLFRGLSVFVGGWTLADAEKICGGTADDVLTGVESLLDKSLIRRLPGDAETAEFSMLESLREFAARLLVSHSEDAGMRARHADHYSVLAVQWEASIGLPEERAWWPRVGRYNADLLAAFEYCLADGRYDQALQLAAALGWHQYTRGDLGHGQALLGRALAAAGGEPDAPPESGAVTTDALAAALLAGGVLAVAGGQSRRGEDLLLRALEYSEERGDARRAATACAFLGQLARSSGQWDASAAWHQRAVAAFEDLGNPQGVAWARHDLGLLARDRGDLASAVNLLRASLRDFRDLDYPWAVAWSAWGLGTTLTAQGLVDEACPLLGEALRIYLELSDTRGVAQCLEALAEVAAELAHHETAARLIGSAAALRDRLAAPQADAIQARTSAVEQTLARSLGPEAAERLRRAGRTMPSGRAAELAMAVASGSAPRDPVRATSARGDVMPLTRRERQVAALVASGATNRQIGRALGISEKTVEVHLQHVMSKLQARSRAEVAAWAATHQMSVPAGS